MKNKWIEITEENNGNLNQIEDLYGAFEYNQLVQFKTESHRIVTAYLTPENYYIDGGWAGSDDSFELPSRDYKFLFGKKPRITHYRIVKTKLRFKKSQRRKIRKSHPYSEYGNVVSRTYFDNNY